MASLTTVAVVRTAPVSRAPCQVIAKAEFAPQKKAVLKVADARSTDASHSFILFRTRLRVNTDGAPNSYHPVDLRGAEKAINSICNGVSVKTRPGGKALTCTEAIEVLAKYRESNWTEPSDYDIRWSNVIAGRTRGGRRVPCTFTTGEFNGYFGSLTSLKNDLPTGQRGECEVDNQLDQRVIRALVMPGGDNPVRAFGAAVGDLVFAVNTGNGLTSAAVIGDSGPPDNLGEGSVALNMALLGRTEQPKNYSEAKKLDTGTQEILVAIVPGSRKYKPAKPFTTQNIDARMRSWQLEAGFTTSQDFVTLIKGCL